MSGLKRFGGFGGKIQIKRKQAFFINMASKIALKSGSVDVEVTVSLLKADLIF